MARRGRIPTPWYRASVGRWYVTLDGRQIPLGSKKREAMAAFHRLMADRGRAVVYDRITLEQLAELWIADRHRAVKPITAQNYERIARVWIGYAGGMLAADIRPYHVDEWIARQDQVRAQATRHLWISVVKMISRWAVVKGYADRDPLFGLRAPAMTRRSPTTLEQLEVVAAVASPELRDIMAVLAATGLRAGELCSMTVELTDLDAGTAVVVGKSGRRVAWLNSTARAVLRRVIGDRTSGPIWPGLTTRKLSHRIDYATRKAGVTGFSAHRLRGLFSTEAIRAGVDSLIVSQLLGHKDPSIVARHYAAPDAAMLREAVERATSGAHEKTPPKRGKGVGGS